MKPPTNCECSDLKSHVTETLTCTWPTPADREVFYLMVSHTLQIFIINMKLQRSRGLSLLSLAQLSAFVWIKEIPLQIEQAAGNMLPMSPP